MSPLFSDRDVSRYDGRLVHFFGRVQDKGSLGDELFIAYLETGGLNRYHWHAVMDRAEWKKVQPGDWVALRGMQRTHGVDGDRYVVL